MLVREVLLDERGQVRVDRNLGQVDEVEPVLPRPARRRRLSRSSTASRRGSRRGACAAAAAARGPGRRAPGWRLRRGRAARRAGARGTGWGWTRLPCRPYRRETPKASPRRRGSLTACWQDPGRERGPGARARRSVGRVRRGSDGIARAEAGHHRQRQRLLLATGLLLSRSRPAARQGAARAPELGRQARRRDAPSCRRRRSERPGVQLAPLRRDRPRRGRAERAGSLHDLRLTGVGERRSIADAGAPPRRRSDGLLVRSRAALRRRVHARRRHRAAAGALLDGVERAQPDDRSRAAVEARRQALGDPERDRLRAHLQRSRRRRARHVDPRGEDRLRRHRSARQQRTAERTSDDLADRVSPCDEARRARPASTLTLIIRIRAARPRRRRRARPARRRSPSATSTRSSPR